MAEEAAATNQPQMEEQVIVVEEPKRIMTGTEVLVEGGIPRTARKVAIVGFAPTTLPQVRAYFGDPDWEIWPINQLYIAMPMIADHATRWFQFHARSSYNIALRDHNHHQWLAEWSKKTGKPVYTMQREPDIPTSVEFPRWKIKEQFRSYFTNTISWLIALAAYEKFETVAIFGVDMACEAEYCISKYAKVLTKALEWVEARKLKAGDEIIAFDEYPTVDTEPPYNGRKWRVAIIEGVQEVIRPTYRISLEDGTELISSQEHRWLTYGENQKKWKATSELVTPQHREGKPTRIVKLLNVWKRDNSWEEGYLAAAFDGEGYISQTTTTRYRGSCFRLAFSQRENEMAQRMRQVLPLAGFDFTESMSNGITNFYIKGGRPELLRFLGKIRPDRLIARFDPNVLGLLQQKDAVAVVSLEFIGEQELLGIKTSTGTMVVEGFASHNSEQRPSVEFYLGWAEGQCLNSDFCPNFRRPNLYIPPACDICSFLWEYPYEDGQRFKIKCDQRDEELGQRQQGHAAEEQQAHGNRVHAIGTLDLLNQFIAEVIDKPEFEFTRENVRAYFENVRTAKRNMLNEAAEAEQRAHDARQQLMGARENMRYIQQSWNQHHRWLATQLKVDSDKKEGDAGGEHLQGDVKPECLNGRSNGCLLGTSDGNLDGAGGTEGGDSGHDGKPADAVDLGK